MLDGYVERRMIKTYITRERERENDRERVCVRESAIE